MTFNQAVKASKRRTVFAAEYGLDINKKQAREIGKQCTWQHNDDVDDYYSTWSLEEGAWLVIHLGV